MEVEDLMKASALSIASPSVSRDDSRLSAKCRLEPCSTVQRDLHQNKNAKKMWTKAGMMWQYDVAV